MTTDQPIDLAAKLRARLEHLAAERDQDQVKRLAEQAPAPPAERESAEAGS